MAKAPDDQVKEDLPLPKNTSATFLGGLFIIAVLACMYAAKDVVIPIVLASFLKLLVQPVMKLMQHLRVPRLIASLLATATLLGCVGGLGDLLSGPAAQWARRLPEGLPRLKQRVSFVSQPINKASELFAHAKTVVMSNGHASQQSPQPAGGGDIQDVVLSTMHHFASGFVWTFLLLFFLLLAGDMFLRRLVEVMPTFGDKRQVIDIAQQVRIQPVDATH